LEDPINLSEIFRNEIDKVIGEGRDLSSRAKRSEHQKEIVANNPNLDQNKDYSSHYGKAYGQVLKKRNIDPRSMGLGRKKIKFVSDLDPTIKPAVQPGPVQSQSQDKKPASIQSSSDEQPIQEPTPMNENITEEALRGVVEAIEAIFKIKLEEFDFSEKQKDALPKMWLPGAQRYIHNEKWTYIGIPAIATIGMLIEDVKRAKKKRQEKSPKDEEQRRCKYCNKTFKKTELEKHQKQCPKSSNSPPINRLTRMCQFCHNDLPFHEHGEHERNCPHRPR